MHIRNLFAFSLLLWGAVVTASPNLSRSSQKIIRNAAKDGIELLSLNFTLAALASIDAIHSGSVGNVSQSNVSSSVAQRIDTHVHAVPAWYRVLVPTTGGLATPAWDVNTHLEFMKSLNITNGILSISSPGANVLVGNKAASAGLARLLNEWLAALVGAYPHIFTFLAVTPLPYTQAAIAETKYALSSLGAVGIGLMSSHEGYYLGNPQFQPYFEAINALPGSNHVIFIHPTSPCLHYEGLLIDANPTTYHSGIVEFYFETARTVMDLLASSTIQNYTNIRYQLPHTGGSFPSILDRFMVTFPALVSKTPQIYALLAERMWWDTQGPTFPHQVQGLLAYGVPKTQLTYGSDYPYAFSYNVSLAKMLGSTFLTAEDLDEIFKDNVEQLYAQSFV